MVRDEIKNLTDFMDLVVLLSVLLSFGGHIGYEVFVLAYDY